MNLSAYTVVTILNHISRFILPKNILLAFHSHVHLLAWHSVTLVREIRAETFYLKPHCHNHMLKKHSDLHPHHQYQLGIICLFILGVLLLFPYYLFMLQAGKDMAIWQWYFVGPWLAFYVTGCLWLRNLTKPYERISPLKLPIIHWVALGISLIIVHNQPIDLERIYSIDIVFSIFSIFLADSYWDFKK